MLAAASTQRPSSAPRSAVGQSTRASSPSGAAGDGDARSGSFTPTILPCPATSCRFGGGGAARVLTEQLVDGLDQTVVREGSEERALAHEDHGRQHEVDDADGDALE